MVSQYESKSSSFSTNSNSTLEYTSSNHSHHSTTDDPFGLSFINGQQLMDDLAIIDDLYAIYGQGELDCSDGESVALMARNIATKHKVLQELCQSESDYISDLTYFQQHYLHLIMQWLQDPSNKGNDKIDKTSIKSLCMYQNLIHVHRTLLEILSERLKIWGAGQIISDCFYHLSQHGTTDRLTNDLLHYLRLPLLRLHRYTHSLTLLIQYSDPLHFDYEALNSVLRSYKRLVSVVQERLGDSQTHLLVFEASRTITSCPIQVTLTRRLLLKSKLIKVDLDDLSSTADVRTYILFNDQLIFCKGNTGGGNNRKQALQYKGTIDLCHCNVQALSPAVCAKMAQAKRPFLTTFRSAQALPGSSDLHPNTPSSTAFGFELVTKEHDMDIMISNLENALSTSGTPLKHRHIIRTQSLEEQALWVDTLGKVIQYIKWLKSNNHP
ncbi:Dbl homology domain-containing protein [Chlamydoabsidia padenii]|nr:Dbl homology domain-containing protein [Chlamydoabsidia padenii]